MHGIELDIETHRIMVARTGNRIEDLNARLIAIEDLEEARNEALDRTIEVQPREKKNSTPSSRTTMELHQEGWCCYMTTATNNFQVNSTPDGWDYRSIPERISPTQGSSRGLVGHKDQWL